MADPRFYDNRGPFTLAEFCAGVNLPLAQDADRPHSTFAGRTPDEVYAMEIHMEKLAA